MSKRLVITEKPSVARDVCAALGGFSDEGDYFESDDWVVTFAVGHLLELAAPEDYDKSLRGWTLAGLPIIPDAYQIKPRTGQKQRLDLIKKLGRRDDVVSVVNACDAGREGEIIFRRIAEYTGLDQRPHQRLWLQSMTKDAIRAGFEGLKDGERYDSLADAAWLRGVGDWLVGMNATRALTKRLRARSDRRGVWSAGRVQTPTLGLLVHREREILAHVPRTYWEVSATFATPEQSWEGRYYDPEAKDDEDRDVRSNRIFERERVDAVLAALKVTPEAPAAEKRRKSKQSPPLPFDLTTLQREANRRFSFSAKRTLSAAQRLYEVHKVLTYPRTDSRYLPDDYGPGLHDLLDKLTADVAYKPLAEGIVRDGPLNLDRVLNGAKVSDHHAIIPTGDEPPTDWSSDDARIYDLVVRQTLAMMMGPATWAVIERQVEVPVPGEAPAIFRTTARALEEPGFLAALGQEAGSGTHLPPLVAGQDESEGVPAQVTEPAEEEKQTKPPPHYTEATLLRLMETAGERLEDDDLSEAMQGRGLGTPATRADTIERLISAKYARRVDGKLAATPKGIRLIDVLERADAPVLASARLTGEWEQDLHRVERGEVSRSTALDNLQGFTRELVERLVGYDHDGLFAKDPPLGRCPSCKQGDVIEIVWGYRCTRNVQVEDGCSFILWKDRNGRYIDRALAEKLVTTHKVEDVQGFVDPAGRSLSGTLLLEPSEDEPGAQWNMRVVYSGDPLNLGEEERGEVLFPCPCGNDACAGIVETNQRYVCQLMLDGAEKRGPVLPKVVCAREMAPDEVAPFFADDGRTPFIEGFTSRRGRPFTGLLFRKPTGKHGFEFPPRAPRKKKDDAEGAETDEAKAPAKKKAATKKTPAKKTPAKKTPAKKTPAKKKAPAKAAAEPGPDVVAAPPTGAKKPRRKATPKKSPDAT